MAVDMTNHRFYLFRNSSRRYVHDFALVYYLSQLVNTPQPSPRCRGLEFLFSVAEDDSHIVVYSKILTNLETEDVVVVQISQIELTPCLYNNYLRW